ncbi:hypothetical protein Glove_213g108 [Diversispora epigaea]|uniref:Protein kinase domain-containing protein n=1 Tax=Diversispora epigaea TaxID=1348612 RepID=A0A397IQZ0_9GLOM|nr:hypothetical protein Glove_213g108 [Diversispora epigaea]
MLITHFRKIGIINLISNSSQKISKSQRLKRKVIHRDLHSKNILYYSDADRWFISDSGFSSPIDDSNNIFKIYGDLPHIAPEVYGNILTTKSDGSTIKYTEKSDIYSLGIIMWEVFTGKIPFDGRKHDIDLALDIFSNKSRPDINNMDENKEYVKLMIKCWDHDPDKRPDIIEIYKRMESLIRPIICKLKEGGGGIGGNHAFSKFNMKKIKNYIKGLMKNNNDSKENKKLESKADSNRINIPQIIESKDENPLTSNIFTKSVEVCDSRQCSECIISDRIELDFNKNNENEATAIEDDNENDIEKTDDNFGSQDNNNRNKITHPTKENSELFLNLTNNNNLLDRKENSELFLNLTNNNNLLDRKENYEIFPNLIS